ncbi:integral membrane protein [Streptomyces zinciresistens K42]|uniref:Integral membrane protein n=1 Tax=Streptomyces zinciresistens K42 TaxID=700597 RepID=G2GIS9_9ACTN|nr:glycerophosphoryl diester phosphodiesterase membrane domain-containing protein [Streptomyces zinciresistens]EGX56594.1 integral membrane protein [Streptomyces zinciresistens K42]
MKDTPGWASPGSAPSDGQEPGTSGPAEPADRPSSVPQPGAEPQDGSPKWSKEQPPPGAWSAPTGSPPSGQTPPPPPAGSGWGTPPPAGPGGGYGGAWGGGWGGPPPAAKPGVIPLRPLGVGEILDGAVSTMRAHWRTVLGISLTVAVVTQILVVLVQGLVLNDSAGSDVLNDREATIDELTRAMGELMLSSGVISVISLIGAIIATALLTTVTSRAVLGKSVTTGEAWRDARPQVPRLFGLLVLLLIMTVGLAVAAVVPGILVAAAGSAAAGAGLILLGVIGGSVVALWLWFRFSLASPALMLEKQGIRKALGRSAKLVRGSWWRVFGIQLLAMLISYIVAGIVVAPFAYLAGILSGDGVTNLLNGTSGLGWTFLIVSGIGSVIGSTVTFPISAGVTVLLYIDQRIRREALDLELARAAGVQGYGSGTPGS